jgi:hypothetical protein
MKTWYIKHLKENTISLSDEVVTQVEGTYATAVATARTAFHQMTNKKAVRVYSEKQCLYWWFEISAYGEEENRNTNAKY